MIVSQVKRSNRFKRMYKKLDRSVKIKVDKILIKIINSPEIGKPMRHGRKGTREVYIKPFRLSYAYLKEVETIYLLDLYHKDKQ